MVVAFILTGMINSYRWKGETGEAWKECIKSDGKGYYAYLPSIFIRGDFGNEKENLLFHVKTEEGRKVNKYTYGTALMQAPFFAFAHVYCLVTGTTADGFSAPYQYAISFAALFYFLAGIFILFRIIRDVFAGGYAFTFIALSAFIFGTPLIYYVIIYPSFSHIYSFFLITLALFLFLKWKESPGDKYGFWFAAIAGLIFITRPVNILFVCFLPVTFSNAEECINWLRKVVLRLKFLIPASLLFSIAILPQLLFWKIQSGHFFYWSYKGEGFYFNDPHFVDFLFSFKKGFFIYAPAFLALIPLLLPAFLKNQFRTLSFLLFFILLTYILSSWYCWYYSDAFGMRPMMDFYGLFAFFILWQFIQLRESAMNFLSGIWIILCIPLNLIFSYQHHVGIFHPNNMNAQKFAMVFLKTGDEYRNIFGGTSDNAPYAPNGLMTLIHIENHFDALPDGALNTKDNEFPCSNSMMADSSFSSAEKIWIQIHFKKKITSPGDGKDLLFVVHFLNKNDSTLLYQGIPVKEYPQEEIGIWQQHEMTLLVANPLQTGEELGLYFWNRSREELLIDDLDIKVDCPK